VLLCSVLLGSAWSLDNGLALTPVMGKLALFIHLDLVHGALHG
jgi:hypothetical protein